MASKEEDLGLETSVLVRRAIEGDRASLERVIPYLTPLVEAQVRYKLGSLARNEPDVEDLVAEVWALVVQRLPDLRPRDGHHAGVLTSFLATTVTYQCNNFLRKAFRRRAASARRSDEDTGCEPELAAETRSLLTRVFQREVTGLIRAALERLPEEKRRIVLLRLMEHKSTVEIAGLLDLKPNTVAVQYRRAIDELREELPPSVAAELWSLRATREPR
jgi:RNA polymerase sigma factor (sigma-70 family)